MISRTMMSKRKGDAGEDEADDRQGRGTGRKATQGVAHSPPLTLPSSSKVSLVIQFTHTAKGSHLHARTQGTCKRAHNLSPIICWLNEVRSIQKFA